MGKNGNGHNGQNNDQYDLVSSFATLTECKCPRCGRIHYKLKFWTGRLPARIYCDFCDAYVNGKNQFDEANSYPVHGIKIHNRTMIKQERE